MNLSPRLSWELARTKWASELNPIIGLPILSGNQIDDISLTANTAKVINHLLQRLPQGWFIVDINANTAIWRTSSWTTTTITLESSADAIISIYVF